MDESTLTVRYSKALFALAKEEDELLSLKNDMELVLDVCKNSVEFVNFLKSPVIKDSEKFRVITLIFKDRVNYFTLNFFRIIINNNRETLVPSVCRHVLTLIRHEKGIKSVILTTAKEIDENILKKLTGILERELGGKVELTNRINPKIIGGIILQIDDKQYDESIATKLKQLKQQLLKATIEA
jgi:F-type H+-transporting ATPase subunit delta